MKSCKSCSHWKHIPPCTNNEGLRFCTFHPPSQLAGNRGSWLQTGQTDFCGQYDLKTECADHKWNNEIFPNLDICTNCRETRPAHKCDFDSSHYCQICFREDPEKQAHYPISNPLIIPIHIKKEPEPEETPSPCKRHKWNNGEECTVCGKSRKTTNAETKGTT